MKYFLTPKYKSFCQLPYCCVPATMQWILYRKNLNVLDQEEIGIKLGLRLPQKAKPFFSNKKVEFLKREPKNGFGTQIEKEKYSINKFFKDYNIALKLSSEFHFFDSFKLEEFLIDNFKKNNDIILRYNNQIFKKNGKGFGHFSLILEYNDNTGIIIIGDPEPPFFKKMGAKDLIYAISDKIDGVQRGIYSVSEL